MAAARKKGKQINLLPQEEFAASLAGRVVRWILTSFRIIVIATEMVVMVAFLSRFWLDARVTDLTDRIKQLEFQIKSLANLETQVRSTQKKLKIFSEVARPPTLNHLEKVANLLPQGISLLSFSVSGKEIQIKGQSLSESLIYQFLSQLENAGFVESLALTQIEAKAASPAVTFTLKGELN